MKYDTNLINELKKDIQKNLELNNLDEVKEALSFGLFIGAKDLLNNLIMDDLYISIPGKELNINEKIKLISLGADSELLINKKIKTNSFYDLLTLSKELPEGINWREKSKLFDNNFKYLQENKEDFYKKRLIFFLPQFLDLHKDKKETHFDHLSAYDQIILEINQNKDYSIFNRLSKIISIVSKNEQDDILDKAIDYAFAKRSNSLYALYNLCNIGENSAITNKFASFFIEKKNGFYLDDLFKTTHFDINLKKINSYSNIPSNKYQKNIGNNYFDSVVIGISKMLYQENKQNIINLKTPKIKNKSVLEEYKLLPEALNNPFLSLAIYGQRENKNIQQKSLSKLEKIITISVPEDISIETIKIEKPKTTVTEVKNLSGEIVLRKDLQRKWDILLINEFYNDHALMNQVVGKFLSENKINFELLNEQNTNLNRMPMAKIKDQWKSPRLFVCGYLSEAANLLLAQKSIDVLSNIENYAKLFSSKKIKTSEQKFTSVNPDVQAEIKEMIKTQRDYDKSTRERVVQRNSVDSLRRSSWNTVK